MFTKDFNQPVQCGGVKVASGDIIIADEEGIAVVPQNQMNQILESAQKKARKEAAQTIQEWEAEHKSRIEKILQKKAFQ